MPNVLTGVLSGTSSIIRTQPLTATENGTYNPPSGVDGYKPVTVNVPQPQPVIEQLTATYNGIYNAPEGVDGYDPVVVNVPAPAPVLDDITITENGHYVPPTGVDGYDDITVNVPAPAPVLDDITITENGHYVPPTGVDGYDDITVNVPLPTNAYLKQTLSGLPSPIATFTGADAPIDSLKASIEGVQSGSGGPSPSNVRPISGWSSCEVTDNNNTYTIPFKDSSDNPITVYRGNINISGGGWYGYMKVIPDLSQLNWSYNSQGFWQSESIPDAKVPSSSSVAGNILCSHLPTKTSYEIYSGTDGIGLHTSNILRIRFENMATTFSEFIAQISGWSLAYELASEISNTFTPIAIRSDGVTNIRVDCGNITECKYFTQS